jgi:hypothetical protein
MITIDTVVAFSAGLVLATGIFLFPIARLMQANARQREIIEHQREDYFYDQQTD